jgi:hypothetical protein
MLRPVACSIRACWNISLPWSQVRVRRSPAGSGVKTLISASATGAAAWPPGSGTKIV